VGTRKVVGTRKSVAATFSGRRYVGPAKRSLSPTYRRRLNAEIELDDAPKPLKSRRRTI